MQQSVLLVKACTPAGNRAAEDHKTAAEWQQRPAESDLDLGGTHSNWHGLCQSQVVLGLGGEKLL